jgi:hypothetical protein
MIDLPCWENPRQKLRLSAGQSETNRVLVILLFAHSRDLDQAARQPKPQHYDLSIQCQLPGIISPRSPSFKLPVPSTSRRTARLFRIFLIGDAGKALSCRCCVLVISSSRHFCFPSSAAQSP